MSLQCYFSPEDKPMLDRLDALTPSRHPIAFVGEKASGRTTLAQKYAQSVSGKSAVTISLQNAQDARDIFGQYTCGQLPGQFVFYDGILTTAMREGRCVLIRNAELLQLDVFSAVGCVLEALCEGRRVLHVMSQEIEIAPDFRLLLTCVPGAKLLQTDFKQHFIVLQCPAFSTDKMRRIIRNALNQDWFDDLIGSLHSVTKMPFEKLLRFTRRIRYDIEHGAVVVNEQFKTTKDVGTLPEDVRRIIIQEIFDVYLAELPRAQQVLAAQGLAQFFRIDATRIMDYLERQHFTVEISHSTAQFTAGRFHIQRLENTPFSLESLKSFALTDYTSRLIQQVVGCLANSEHTLLISPTGIGKTYTLDIIAKAYGTQMLVINFSAQTEVADLMGGFKPATEKQLATELYELVMRLVETTLDQTIESNQRFVADMAAAYGNGQTEKLCQRASQLIRNLQAAKRVSGANEQQIVQDATQVLHQVEAFKEKKAAFFFQYKDGILLQAIKKGLFILLDEINLAPNDVLEYVESVLCNEEIRVIDQKSGKDAVIKKHPHFRVCASMNPATDVGKKALSKNLMQQFTVFNLVEMEERSDLFTLVRSYIKSFYDDFNTVVDLFVDLKKRSQTELQTTNHQTPVYSIRLLCRALRFAQYHWEAIGAVRALAEGFQLYFTSNLDLKSAVAVSLSIRQRLNLAEQTLLLDFQPKVHQLPFLYQKSRLVHVLGGIHFPAGPEFKGHAPGKAGLLASQGQFVLTETNTLYIKILLNALLAGTPILLEGVTSSGKSSLVLFLAGQLGYPVVRINNHENVDLQDYVGGFQPDPLTGQLRFQHGPLVRAMQTGAWVILDELNLCGSEILESLNRLLDDNGELYLPETGETIKAAPGFALFATQNPSGLVQGQFYGGRKQLSAAFRNRFVLVETAEISQAEQKFILQHRDASKNLAQSFLEPLVQVCAALRLRLSHTLTGMTADLVSQQITLRDLFRIADRLPPSKEALAAHIFMLVGEKQRTSQLKELVFQVISEVLKLKIDQEFMDACYRTIAEPFVALLNRTTDQRLKRFRNIVFTKSFVRQFALTLTALRYNENPCLIGDCGSGKTQVAELAAAVLNLPFMSINLHKNTDVSDMIGQLRPLRNRSDLQDKLALYEQLVGDEQDGLFYQQQVERIQRELNQLFTWYDGPLVQAMQRGAFLLIDEISLASDSILERLNSVFETGRELTLSEKPDFTVVRAASKFKVVSTMNPGGDYGKKELSPALRNRMTEIYVEAVSDPEEVAKIVSRRLTPLHVEGADALDLLVGLFATVKKLTRMDLQGASLTFSIRDIVGIAEHLNSQFAGQSTCSSAEFIDVIRLCFLDGLQMRCPQLNEQSCEALQRHLVGAVLRQISEQEAEACEHSDSSLSVTLTESGLKFFGQRDDVTIPYGPQFSVQKAESAMTQYCLNAPTTAHNAIRLAYALISATRKPMLLESSPGVGKTSLIQMLADICGYELVRVNLSEHIDLSDLVGQDLPAESGEGDDSVHFKFVYGPVSRAVSQGQWLLLDELNLASQSVLEGLNSLLDHRRELYVPETNQTLKCGSNFRLFGAQNPYSQGGGRKQLPQSFLNRFVCLYLQPLQRSDYSTIIASLRLPQEISALLNSVVHVIQNAVNVSFGFTGGPWEVNLRDVFRIADGLDGEFSPDRIARLVAIVFQYQYRTVADQQFVQQLLEGVLAAQNIAYNSVKYPALLLNGETLRCGAVELPIRHCPNEQAKIFTSDLPFVEATMFALKSRMATLFTTGRQRCYVANRIVRGLAATLGQKLNVISLAQSTDITDLIGQFEQLSSDQLVRETVQLAQELFICYSLGEKDQAQKGIEALKEICMDESALLSPGSAAALLERIQALITPELFDEDQKRFVLAQIKAFIIQLHAAREAKFLWKDGVVTRAAERGEWLYLQNVNFCQASVLDRLNSLLERGGSLYIFEQGKPEIRRVEIHQNFRVFLAYDSSFGEISRAIRNRCLELSLDCLDHVCSTQFGPVEAELANQFDLDSMCTTVSGPQYTDLFVCQRLERQLLSSLDKKDVSRVLESICAVQQATSSETTLKLLRQNNTPAHAAAFVASVVKTQDPVQIATACGQALEFLAGHANIQVACSSVGPLLGLTLNEKEQNIRSQCLDLLQQCTARIKPSKLSSFSAGLLKLSLPFQTKLDEIFALLTLLKASDDNVASTIASLFVAAEKMLPDQLRLLRCLVDEEFVQQRLSPYGKNLIYSSFLQTESQAWQGFRKQLNLAAYAPYEKLREMYDASHQSLAVDYSYNKLSYKGAADLLNFLFFDKDPFQIIAAKCKGPNTGDAMLSAFFQNMAMMNQHVKGPSAIFQCPATQYVCKLLGKSGAIKARDAHNTIQSYKAAYNTMLQESQTILRRKFDVIAQIITEQTAFCQVLGVATDLKPTCNEFQAAPREILCAALENACSLYLRLTPEGQVDPAQQKQYQLEILDELLKKTQNIPFIGKLQEYTEGRRQAGFGELFQAVQMLREYGSACEKRKEQIKNEAIDRKAVDGEFFLEVQEQLERIDLPDRIDAVVQDGDKKQALERLKFAVLPFLDFLYQQEAEKVLSYVDVIAPLVYCFTNALVFADLLCLWDSSATSGAISSSLLASYYRTASPFQLYFFLEKQQPELADNFLLSYLRHGLDAFVDPVIAGANLRARDLNINNLAQVAAAFQSKQIDTYMDYINDNSPYRTRLQSKTSGDETDAENLERQIEQIFQTEDGELRAIVHPPDEEQADAENNEAPEKSAKPASMHRVNFITEIGRLMLSTYGERPDFFRPSPDEYFKLIQTISQIMHKNAGDGATDQQCYLLLLDSMRACFAQVQEETTPGATILSKVRSHKTRRSQACRNIYSTPYPAETYQFCTEKIAGFQARVKELRKEFEDNAKLLEIQQVATLIEETQFISTPLARILGRVEALVSLALEWNGSAPRVYQFSEELMNVFKSQIVHWRRIELMSWNTFFEEIKSEQETIALLEWPALLIGALTAAGQDASRFSETRKDFVQQVRSFLYHCEAGQFPARRCMILAISRLVLQTEYCNRTVVAGELRGLFDESGYAEAEIVRSVTESHKLLQKEFTNQIRLFQWDERSFHTLRMDCKKSHRMAVQILRKYNEAFQTPVGTLLRRGEPTRFVIQPAALTDKFLENSLSAAPAPMDPEPWRVEPIDQVLLGLAVFHKKENGIAIQQRILKQFLEILGEVLQCSKERTVDISDLKILALYYQNDASFNTFMACAAKFQIASLQVHADIKPAEENAILAVANRLASLYFQMHRARADQEPQCNMEHQACLLSFVQASVRATEVLKNMFQSTIQPALFAQLEQHEKDLQSGLKLLETKRVCATLHLLNALILEIVAQLSTKRFDKAVFAQLEENAKTVIATLELHGTELQSVSLASLKPIGHVFSESSWTCDINDQAIRFYSPIILEFLGDVLRSGVMAAEPKQDENEQQQQKEPQNGTGLADGAGEKDITEQVQEENMNEDDLIGNDNEHNDEQQQDESAGDNGMELEQDFGGQLQDLERSGSEEQQESEELDRDLGDESLGENKEDQDKRGADEDEEQHNPEQQDASQQEQQQMLGNLEEEQQEDSAQQPDVQDQPEQEVQYEQPPEDLDSFQDAEQDNPSMQTQNEEDVNLSELFDDVFQDEEEVHDMSNMQEESLEEKIEQVDQLFDEKESDQEAPQEEQKESEVSIEQQEFSQEEQQWAQEDEQDANQKGFAAGQEAQANSSSEERSTDEKDEDPLDRDRKDDERNKSEKEKNEKKLETKEVDTENQDKPEKMNKRLNENKDQKPDVAELSAMDEGSDKADAEKSNAMEDSQNSQVQLIDQRDGSFMAKLEDKSDQPDEQQIAQDNGDENAEKAPADLQPQKEPENLQEMLESLRTDAEIAVQAGILAERLKILLEPTLNSSLIGDFRSGKKLNLKKIIPFIASDYRKDKIWLRRTRPQKRTYRVVLCVDNSFSLQNNTQMCLQVLQSISIIFRAVKQAELGKLCVALFDADFRVLYELSDVFNEHQLYKALEALRFDAPHSNFKAALDGARNLLLSDGTGDAGAFQNILIVLSDGQVNEKNGVGASYRQMIKEKILPIFLFYDKRIFDQQSVQFILKDGKRQIVKRAYLEDEYPLENFMVNENAATLTETLCAALVQFLQQVM